MEEALASCEQIGYPVMIKASWGGGGKGIRKVVCAEDLPAAFKQASSTLHVIRISRDEQPVPGVQSQAAHLCQATWRRDIPGRACLSISNTLLGDVIGRGVW